MFFKIIYNNNEKKVIGLLTNYKEYNVQFNNKYR
jgi:hypothetical protein